MPQPKSINPFYIALLVVSIAFVITVCGYTVLTFRGGSREVAAQPRVSHGLLDFLDEHGVELMLAEVAVLGVATVGAIMTDQYWSKRAYQKLPDQKDPSQT
jgi:hypothetical protein